MQKQSDDEIRKLADCLGDWMEKDAILHIPQNAKIERETIGAWVECKVLVPWPDDSKRT